MSAVKEQKLRLRERGERRAVNPYPEVGFCWVNLLPQTVKEKGRVVKEKLSAHHSLYKEGKREKESIEKRKKLHMEQYSNSI